MIRRLSSIDWKFPLVMSGLILATAALFIWSAYAQFTAALYEETGQRLRAGARLIAPLVGGPTPQRRTRFSAAAEHEAIRRFLRASGARGDAAARSGPLAEAARAALLRELGDAGDSLRVGLQLLTRRGDEALAVGLREGVSVPAWFATRIRADSGGTMRPDFEFSPIFEIGGRPGYQVASAVVARGFREGADTTLGFLVETRRISGRGQAAIRELLGAGTFLVGSPEAGVWTDMQTVLDGPPPIAATDSVLLFDVSPRGPGVGTAQPVEGTPWVVWLQQPQAEARLPANVFVWRIVPVAAAIALVGALIVWLLSRGVTNRLVALTYEVDRMEAGQGAPLAAADELDSDDEIARLEHAFDRMGARVEQQQRLEAQLMQSQKIEAVGRLAGGIAHDFNNVLTVVRNYTELVRTELPPDGEAQRDLDEVLRATERAAGLTRQLLAFSRQQVIAPQDLDVNEVIEGSQRMLTRVIPSNVVFVAQFDRSIPAVHADRGQLEQVLLNLTINAVDAMPDGGSLTIRTSMAPVTARPEVLGAPPAGGRFVCVSVADTGTGMSAETLARIFEPFFTTKPVGKGTGLGLATAHGIVTQAGGHLGVESEPGKDTTFTLYFPPSEGAVAAVAATGTPPSMYAVPPETNGPRLATVLVVEDDPATREVTRRLLERSGYRIVEAQDANAALVRLGSGDGRIDLVLTDVMMPGLSGVELAARIGERWPKLPVLMMSGYSDAEVRAKGALGRQRSLIEKPFTAAGLLTAVESALRE